MFVSVLTLESSQRQDLQANLKAALCKKLVQIPGVGIQASEVWVLKALWKLPDLWNSQESHRSLEIAVRFPRLPQGLAPSFRGESLIEV